VKKNSKLVLKYMEEVQSFNLETMIFSMGQITYSTKLEFTQAKVAMEDLLDKKKVKHLVPSYVRGSQPRIWYVLAEEMGGK
jgi:hypothetical protein